MAKLAGSSIDGFSQEECLTRMASHLTNWAIGLIEQIGNDFLEGYELSHPVSRSRILNHLHNLQDDFRRSIRLLEAAASQNEIFLRWLNNAQKFSTVLTRLVKRCSLVKDTASFLELAGAITHSALDNCKRIGKVLTEEVDDASFDEYETLVWRLPSWYSEQLFDELV